MDSRTGITESGGLCVGPLADRLVVVTALNDQNVVGTRDFLREVGVEPVKRSRDAEPWDDADPVAADDSESDAGLGPKPTLIVASPLPAGEIAFKKQRLEEVERSLGSVAVTLSYHPQMAVMETLFVRDHRSEYLAKEYEQLTERVMVLVRDAPSQLLVQWQELPEAAKQRGEAALGLLRLASAAPALGATLLPHAADALKASDDETFRLARRLHATISMSARGTKHEALNNWGIALSDQAETKVGAEADGLFAAAYEKYERALELKPDLHDALNNWGAALSGQAKTKLGAEADRLFAAAYEKFERALELKPDLHDAPYNWGTALLNQAKTKTGEPRARLLTHARERLLAAEALRSGSAAAYNLACIEALEGDVEACVSRLRSLRAAGNSDASRTRIENDDDFEGVKNDPTFRAFLDELLD